MAQGIQKVAPKDRGAVPQRSETAATRVLAAVLLEEWAVLLGGLVLRATRLSKISVTHAKTSQKYPSNSPEF